MLVYKILRQPEWESLRVEGLTKHFTQGSGFIASLFEQKKVKAVENVSFDIRRGETLGLVGESGCGKTTLGKTAIGLQEPTDGTVSYRGQDIWEAKDGSGEIPWSEIRRSLQIIHQDPGSAINPNKRVLHTLQRPLKRWQDLPRRERERRIYTLLERVGMSPAADYAGRFPHQLSGGEKQRVALIRALLMNPDLILADEAVSALDVSLRVEMMDLMLELQDDFDTSYVFISHDLSNARYFTAHGDGKIGVMYLGELAEIGPAEEMIRDPHHPYTQGLLASVPVLGQTREELAVIPGTVPGLINPPQGCRFANRCAHRFERCDEPIELLEKEDKRQVRCWLYK